MKRQIILMDKARMRRTLRRMAIQVWERVKDFDQIVLIGLNERGLATANELAEHLSKLVQIDVKVVQFTVDDSNSKKNIPNCNDKFVLLVDDVIFSGKTMFDALSAVCSINEPASIEIAALLDRGHRAYPLRTDLTGIKVPTKLGEHIEVMLKEGTLEQAVLFKN
ncbi:MAG: phosphoribosyltransferase family protein [Balneolaceae bacterium]